MRCDHAFLYNIILLGTVVFSIVAFESILSGKYEHYKTLKYLRLKGTCGFQKLAILLLINSFFLLCVTEMANDDI